MASELSAGKRILFSVITVAAFFALLEGLLAMLGIRAVIAEQDPYVGFSDQQPLFRQTGSGTLLRTAANKLALFNDQTFDQNKDPGTYRIFTLGGSVTYGRPFEGDTAFSAWLQSYLRRAAPDRHWEVINAGGISYASYRVARVMEELVDYQPDLFILMTGHNEFLEKRTYGALIAEPEAVSKTKMVLQRTRLWALGHKLATRRQAAAERRYELTGEVQELLDSSVGLDYYVRDDEFQRRVLDHYRLNLKRMIRLAGSSGAEVILVNLPSNRKDFSTFKSQHRATLDPESLASYPATLEAAVTALDDGRVAEAIDSAARATALDPLYAEGHFVHGRALFAAQIYSDAEVAFDRAVEEDVCPLRALESINRSVAEASRREGVPLVDFRDLVAGVMRERHGHPIPGDELFLDHVHPTVETHGLLARSLADQMAKMGIVDLPAGWHDSVGGETRAEILGRVDDEARATAYKNLSKVLIWAGKQRQAEKYTRLAAESLGDDWEVHYNAGSVALDAERFDQAVHHLREAVRQNSSAAAAYDLLGLAQAAAGDQQAAVAAGQRAVEIEPDQAGFRNNLAVHLSRAGRPDEALSAVREALRLDPEFAEAYNNLGEILFARGDSRAALSSFERSIALRPRYLEAMFNRGLALGDLQRLGEAESAFREILQLEPEFASAHLGLGRVQLATGDTEAAIGSFQRSIELDPQAVESWEVLIQTLAATRSPEVSDGWLQRGLAAHPESPALLQLAARSRARAGRLDEAASLFSRAIDLDPDRLSLSVDLGNLRMMQGDAEGAIEAFGAALDRHPMDDRLHHLLASVLLVSGRLDEARPYLQEALRLNPGNAAATLDLAKLEEQQGRLPEALALYRTSLQLDGSLEEAQSGLARLSSR